ncbi:MAG: hypothetical protein ACI376_00340 [Candidatus Bruticola sp.]
MKIYTNGRFQFAFSYPESCLALEEPANGDGRSFYSSLLLMKITGSGFYSIANESALEAACKYVPEGITWEKVDNLPQNIDHDISIKWQYQNNCCLMRVLRIKEDSQGEAEHLLIIKVEFPQNKADICTIYAEKTLSSLHNTAK